MIKRYPAVLLFCLVLLGASSCIDEMLVVCNKIVLAWIKTNPVTEEGTPVNVVIIPGDGSPEKVYDSDIHAPEIELPPGKQTILMYEKHGDEYVNRQSQTVSVPTDSDGKMIGDPAFFSGGSLMLDIASSNYLELPLYKQVRELIIRLKFTGAGASMISGVTGNFDGIASERHINNGFRPADPTITRPPAIRKGAVDYSFGREKSASETLFSGHRNLLGIDGEVKQMLSLTVTFSNGEKRTLQFDATELMDGFHTEELDPDGGEAPWYIILTFDINTSFKIIIIDWNDGGTAWVTPA